MQDDPTPQSIDISFSVPQVHRLRFTHDILSEDRQVLLDLLESPAEQPARVQVWCDENVAAARPELQQRIDALLASEPERVRRASRMQIVPGGEAVKNDIHILERMLKVFNAAELDRWSYVIAIGGGAMLDAVGFAAAIAHRGIRLIRLPTTTLAQADSALGVKNGVNLFQKKNWIGSFCTPWAVVNDTALLSTLPTRDFRCGFAESVKVALLKSSELLDTICADAKKIDDRQMDSALPIIRETALCHLRHITQGGDPFEQLEARPLDYGHWSAHKLETMTNFEMRHGEAVAIGVAIDTVYSARTLGLRDESVRKVLQCLADLGFSLNHPALANREELRQGLEEFRQHLGGRLTLTMLQQVGQPIEIHEVDWDEMNAAIDHVVQFAGTTVR